MTVYKLKIQLFEEHIEQQENPLFIFDTVEQVITFMNICFENGYDVLISKDDEQE